MNKLSQFLQLLHNMGGRYLLFRSKYEWERRTGLLKKKFKINPPVQRFLSVTEWKESASPFFFQDRKELSLPKYNNSILKQDLQQIKEGNTLYFNGTWLHIDTNYDWVTNPYSGYKYDISGHWTEVEDIDPKAGDIKYVWEKSRFSFLYTIIRYDYHYQEDHATLVLGQILDWIAKNPINCGPNYKCSQEISLRVLNWIFALYFYRDSKELTEENFQKIIHSIYWQLQHVYQNINFSRIAVRNNHAITETLTLYLVGMLFPEFPDARKWKKDGKKWFEEEIAYQIAEDGTYLQFSMNYQRVVVQLLTWAIALADRNEDKFSNVVYERAYQTVNFLFQCQDEPTGWLPNYGANDGALFFKLNDKPYRDYRPQLDALHYLLTGKGLYQTESVFEDIYWYLPRLKVSSNRKLFSPLHQKTGSVAFPIGGYYLIREKDTLTFIRCGKYKDRPGHADNLHLDIWYKGQNILMDGGTYKYNTDPDDIKYFAGTASHNTVMLGDNDQMLKGPRFIWFDWSQALTDSLKETDTAYEFTGEISCFKYIGKQIIHRRTVRKTKHKPEWEIIDEIRNAPQGYPMRQLWHTSSDLLVFKNEKLQPLFSKGWFSSLYGIKTENKQIEFSTPERKIQTLILIKETK